MFSQKHVLHRIKKASGYSPCICVIPRAKNRRKKEEIITDQKLRIPKSNIDHQNRITVENNNNYHNNKRRITRKTRGSAPGTLASPRR